MGREMVAVREEVRECRIGVREEMRESEARLMGEIGNMTKEVEGLTIGQNELKEQMEKNTGAIKELRAAEKEAREMTAIKNECKMAHEKLTKRVEEVTQTMGTKEREMETQIETTKVTLEGEIQGAHWELTMVKEEVDEVKIEILEIEAKQVENRWWSKGGDDRMHEHDIFTA